MPISENWTEVRRSIPPDEAMDVPDDSIDYECWKHSRGDGLTIYKVEGSQEFILHRNVWSDQKIVGEYHDYQDAKDELERQKMKGFYEV